MARAPRTCMLMASVFLLILLLVSASTPSMGQDPREPSLRPYWGDGDDIPPLEPTATISYTRTLHVQCPFGSVHTTPPQVDLDLVLDAPFLTATVTPSTWSPAIGPETCTETLDGAGYSDQLDIEVSIGAAKDAPAFLASKVTLIATPSTNDPPAELEDWVTIDFTGSFEVVEPPVQEAGRNAHVSFPVRMINHANGDIMVRFGLSDDEPSFDDADIAMPPPVIVPSAARSDLDNEVRIFIDAKTTTQGEGTVTQKHVLRVMATSVDDESRELDPHVIELTAQVSGTYIEIGEGPASGTMVAITLLAAMALGLSRRTSAP